MPPNFFQRPETALKRAEELIKVGKDSDALETLHDTIKGRRHKQWTQTHELIMIKHVELCVLLKRPHIAKDALFQYKAITQQIAVKSLETVIVHFLSLAEQKTEEAQKTSIERVEEIDDLDQGDVPETLLLSVVSGAAAQDRMDRTVLAPWLRFLWDSYRNCLELLRNNAQVEQLYHRITRQSFQFCAKYQRRTEFRKLCDLLRMHLNQVQKHQHMPHVIKLTSAESLSQMQETRLCQLDTAIQMELWQEAYRSAEDVHGMMQLSKDKDRKMVKPASYVNYFDKLALVFWKAGNRLFHAAALLQKYIIYKDMKKTFTAEEAQDQATRVLLATLSIPDGADAPSDLTRHLDIEDQHGANVRLLSNLLRLPITPSRSGLLKEAVRLSVPDIANESTRNLYKLLENNFAPLRLAKDTDAQLTLITQPEYQQYVEPIRTVLATKALKQISVIYDSIGWERVRKIISFYDELELERLIVDVSKHRYVKAQIDHRSGCVRFGAADVTLAGGVDCDFEDTDGFTGDDAQLGVEGIRTHLQVMNHKLEQMINRLDGDKRKEELVARVKQHAVNYERNRQQEFDRIMMRRRKIENYKETSERVRSERKQLQEAEQQKKDEARRADEMKRLEQDNIEAEKRRKEAERAELDRKMRQDQLRRMQQTEIYRDIIKEKGELAFQGMDPETVMREQRERLDRQRAETQKRLQQQEKTFDHHIRALHLEEMLERKAVMGVRIQEAPKAHEEYEKKRVEKAIEAREHALATWNKWEEIGESATDWIADVKERNASNFQKKCQDFQAKLEAVRADRLSERAEQRKKERRDKFIRQKQEEERLKREEEERQRQQERMDRRPHGGDRGERAPREDFSKAMVDNDWRGGARAAAPAPRPLQPRDRDDRRPDDRGPERQRGPMREMNSEAEQDRQWRSGMAPAAPPSSRPPLNIQRRTEPEAPTRADFGTRRPIGGDRDRDRDRAPPPSSVADSGTWSRGNIVKKEAPAPAPAEPTSAPAPARAGGAYVPPSRRREGDGGVSSGPRDGPRDGPRGGPPPRGAPAASQKADSDNNWRRK